MSTWDLRTTLRQLPCRAGHPGCRIPWGYDEQHTDSSRPYTLDELAERAEGPHRYAYPSHEEYLQGWRLWRALSVDSRPTRAEADVALRVRFKRIAAVTEQPWLLDILEEAFRRP
ncbi:hypothetical protein E1091_01525 [Micromonospora fluostatini]|uniref:Uncharacterized protein n=1 Tax=Micromonospora fluostatini TaxID=1629071 RepID=A0ABY2DLU4_9ACTN|nr:hypothetical protein E1091_01525 [Micromonospora fluostatini]